MNRLLLTAVLTLSASSLFAADYLTFQRIDVDPVFRSEGAAIADFNNDGKPDLGVGELYYAAPDWKPVPFNGKGYSEFQWQGYSNVFGAAADDVNGDGFVDFIRLPWPGQTQYWYANPGKSAIDGVEWKEYKITDVLNNESPVAKDMDNDGVSEIIGGWNPDAKNTNGPQRRVVIFKVGEDPTQPWTRIDVSELNHPAAGHYSHGFGVGDVNGDGRQDIVTPFGYFLQPKEGLVSGAKWEEVKADFGPECSHMQVADFDEDGKAEIFITSAHNFGIWMFKQNKDGGWDRIVIEDPDDKINSQYHATKMVDMNGDGKLDIVTGKRWMAHCGRDPGAFLPAELIWYENKCTPEKVKWVRHLIDGASGVATNFDVGDVNGDGKPDVLISNKRGVMLFLQK